MFVKPQLSHLVQEAPDGPGWLHEIRHDGYRTHAHVSSGDVRLLTRTGLDWTHKYQPIAAALSELPVGQAYVDGELSGVRPDGNVQRRFRIKGRSLALRGHLLGRRLL
jgi:ATP-dependent DNA ligase